MIRGIQFLAVGLPACLALSSCSAESIRRTGYETAQNVAEQQCLEANAEPCNERIRYETYERERKEE